MNEYNKKTFKCLNQMYRINNRVFKSDGLMFKSGQNFNSPLK